MPWIPGWSSASSASWWSNFYFWFGIVCLFLLGASEIVSHIYTLRKDALVEAGEGAAFARQQQEQRETERRHRTETEELRRQLEDAQQKQAPRRLTNDQKQEMAATLSEYPGQKVRIFCVLGDVEGKAFAEDFMEVFRKANWDTQNSIIQGSYSHNPQGFHVGINAELARQEGMIPFGVGALDGVLFKFHLVSAPLTFDNASQAGLHEVLLEIGTQPK